MSFDINSKVAGVIPGLQPSNPAYNTYVGARYVPVFGNAPTYEWDDTKAYEPLTIVLHEGNSYTSVTFVPVGADINDTKYWAKTGNYNAQVAAYQKKVEDLKNDIQEYSYTKSTKNIICIGDSYGLTEDDVTGWTEYLKQMIPTDGFFRSNSVGGAGFSSNLPGLPNFLGALQALNFTDSEKQQVTDIIVGGGYNDLNTGMDSLINSITGFVDYANTTFPNAVVHVYFMAFDRNSPGNRGKLAAVENIYSLAAGKYSYKSVAWLMSTNTNLTRNFNHPNSNGCKLFAQNIFNDLYGGGISKNFGYMVDQGGIKFKATEEGILFDCFGTFTLDENLNSNTWAKIGTGNGVIQGQTSSPGNSPSGFGFIAGTTNSSDFYPCRMIVVNGDYYVGNQSGKPMPAGTYLYSANALVGYSNL